MMSRILGISLILALQCVHLLQGQTIVNNVASLQSAIASATEGEVIQLSASFPTTLGAAITATIGHTNNFVVDGNGITLNVSGNYRHFSISKTTSTGTFTLRNIELKGLRTNSNGVSVGPGGGGVAISGGSQGIIAFDHVYFNSIQNGALVFSGLNTNALVRVSNSTFRNNNKADHGGAIFYQGTGNLEVLDCTFDENYNAGAGYSGGAIVCFNHAGRFTVKRTVFLNNLSINWGGAIGVYSPQGITSSILIDSCYFEGNSVTIPNGNGDGGAVSVYGNVGQATKFDLRNSTFYRNHASDDGGAVFIQNYDTGAENYITNCTMYENYGGDVNPATTSSINIATCGGAIQLSLKSPVTLESNTIIQNYTKSTYQRGGGLGFHAATAGAPIVKLKNNIILGNYILDASNNKIYNTYANVGFRAFLNPSVTQQTGNIGYDNGTALPANVTILNTFGNNNPVQWEDLAITKIGNPNETNAEYYRIIPTISVKPNDGTDVLGLADRQGVASSLVYDERGYLRDQANPSVGAIEIRWAKFDANGGIWASLPNLSYNGTTYYEKNGSGNVENYYQITYQNGGISSPSARPSRADHVFTYWALDNPNGARWDGLPLTITSNRMLYAVWRLGFIQFDNDTICEPEKADLTNLTLISGSLTGVTLSYYTDSLCTIPVLNPEAVGGGTYYIVGVNASNQRDTTFVDIIENQQVEILLRLKEDTCIYFNRIDSFILEITDSSGIIIPGTEKWFLDKKQITDPHTYVLSLKDDGKSIYYQVDTRCGIVQSNKIELEFCPIDPSILRSVWIPEVAGLGMSLRPGEHFVKSREDFVFTMSPFDGYNLDSVIVKTNNPKWDENEGVELVRISKDTIKVRIKQVTEPLILTIEGVAQTNSAALITDATIWTFDKYLYLDIKKAMRLSVYTISGSLYTQRYLSEGKTVLPLPCGVYIIMLDGRPYLKTIIR